MNNKPYSLKEPKYFVGQRIAFLAGKKQLDGVIHRVETYYRPDNRGVHSYTVSPDGWRRSRHIGEEDVLGVEASPVQRAPAQPFPRGHDAYIVGIDGDY